MQFLLAESVHLKLEKKKRDRQRGKNKQGKRESGGRSERRYILGRSRTSFC
jgi:hypothetical protein